jgi:hypothetical protein
MPHIREDSPLFWRVFVFMGQTVRFPYLEFCIGSSLIHCIHSIIKSIMIIIIAFFRYRGMFKIGNAC